MRVPFGWFFSLFHFVMDLVLATVLIFDRRAEMRREKRPWTLRPNDSIVLTAALPQESGAIEFDPMNIDAPTQPPI